jgi:wobble nucleotide-excising tRNase
MKITRISKLKGYRLFRDFAWPSDLQAFGRFNLIYGWNGTGKTTLAALFRNLQDKTAVTVCDVVFEVDDRSVKGADVPSAVLPPVRVFNRDLVTATVLASEREIAPIYFLGQDSVEKQQQVDKLKKDLTGAETELKTAQSGKAAADKALDVFCIERGKFIKDLLTSSRSATYNNYDKRSFRQAVDRLSSISKQASLLQDEEKTKLCSQKNAQPKATLSKVDCDVPSFAELTASTEGMLKRSVVSKVIDALASDREVGIWVHQGLALHTGARRTDECRFCGQKVPPARVAALEAHFNDAFSQFQAEIDALAAKIESHNQRLADLALPDSSRLYEHLVAEFDAARTTTRGLIEPAVAYLGSLHARLTAKRESPFTPETFNGSAAPDRDAILRAIGAMRKVIEEHNSRTARFENEVDAACQKLEQCYVAEAYDEFIGLRDASTSAESAVTAAVDKAQGLRDQIVTVERDIVEHRRPAEELNAELHAYLGRDELRFEVKEAGYSMTRNGQPASNLSEGEKTAIAFLYFLKSLQDKSFDLANGVVVIDDPVSSLDANSLFSAFAYMKERTKDAGQLFVLTHNFCFFRQVKNWFDYMLKRKNRRQHPHKPAPYFLLRASARDGNREATLAKLDPLLDDYDSEYHYLFKLVYEESQRNASEEALEASYGMPNAARRLLEAFLSFRFPTLAGELYQQLEEVAFEPAKKARILRFLQTHSHHGHVAEPEHDLSVLSETGAVLGDVLALIEATDAEHFREMEKLVGGTQDFESDS